jgi:hypothetical protein
MILSAMVLSLGVQPGMILSLGVQSGMILSAMILPPRFQFPMILSKSAFSYET